MAPKVGFKYLSVWLVKKKLIKLFLIASLVVYVDKNTPGLLKFKLVPTAVPGLVWEQGTRRWAHTQLPAQNSRLSQRQLNYRFTVAHHAKS